MRKLDIYSQGDNSNTNHPYSLLTNTQGGVDGTTTDANQINDPMYALYAVLNKAGIVPNNNLESVANSQFLQALTELFENNMPYKAGKTYNVGDTFTIGGITHIVIPENNATTAKFSDAIGVLAGLTSQQELFLSNRVTGYTESLKAGYERFRAEAVPLHLYEKGVSSPVIDGINLTSKYPKFFANCNGLNASGQYNTSRKAFIDDNLQYLVNGGVYKTFDIPQGFGLVNNQTNMGLTTGGVVQEHTHFGADGVNHHTYNDQSVPKPLATIYKAYNRAEVEGQSEIRHPDTVYKNTNKTSTNVDVPQALLNKWMQIVPSDIRSPDGHGAEGELNIKPTQPNSDIYWGFAITSNANKIGFCVEMFFDEGGKITPDYALNNPNYSAGIQLGYYTLLKMV